MGHYAKSFALKDQPGNFVSKHSEPKALPPTNRLTYNKDRQSDIHKSRIQNDGKKRKFSTMVQADGARMPKSMSKKPFSLTTSEFDSGLPPLKKKKKN